MWDSVKANKIAKKVNSEKHKNKLKQKCFLKFYEHILAEIQEDIKEESKLGRFKVELRFYNFNDSEYTKGLDDLDTREVVYLVEESIHRTLVEKGYKTSEINEALSYGFALEISWR